MITYVHTCNSFFLISILLSLETYPKGKAEYQYHVKRAPQEETLLTEEEIVVSNIKR